MAFNRSKELIVGTIGLAVVVSCWLLLHLFHSEELDNPELGLIVHKYRWGVAYEELVDSNRDGSYDVRALFDGKSRSFGTHNGPVEFWEDRDYNGVFEIHAVMDGDAVGRVELDRDQDGEYDEILKGPEAARFFESLIVPEVDPAKE